MRHYVGSKQIKAKPMTRGEYCTHRGWEIPKDENAEDKGYLVEYSDGYISWSPEEQFNASYKDITKVGLDIYTAFKMVKGRKCIGMARKGWNGAGMYVVYQEGYPEGIECDANTAKAFYVPEGTLVHIRPHLQLLCADGSIAEWSPSGSDLIEEDWMLVFTIEQLESYGGFEVQKDDVDELFDSVEAELEANDE